MKTSDYRVLSTHTAKQIYHIILISNQKLSDSDKYKNMSQTQCISELFYTFICNTETTLDWKLLPWLRKSTSESLKNHKSTGEAQQN